MKIVALKAAVKGSAGRGEIVRQPECLTEPICTHLDLTQPNWKLARSIPVEDDSDEGTPKRLRPKETAGAAEDQRRKRHPN